MAIKIPEDLKIIVIYTDGSVGKYESEAKAYDAINLHEHSATGVKMVIVGNELGMVTEVCERFLCFDKKDKCVNDEDGIARMHLKQ